jgi:hypothetical protein
MADAWNKKTLHHALSHFAVINAEQLRALHPDDCGDPVRLEYRDAMIAFEAAQNTALMATGRNVLAACKVWTECGRRLGRARSAMTTWFMANRVLSNFDPAVHPQAGLGGSA